ncbi:MAG: hypothetical protein JXA72_09195 [Bacteroidales bacterium]|nr:hypothetical protein [Bacteroidales bacterium]
MTPQEHYKARVEEFRLQADRLQKKENRLSLARLIVFILSIGLFFALYSFNHLLAIGLLTVGLIAFARLVHYYNNTERSRIYARHLQTINYLEGACLKGSFFEYPDGSEYVDRVHPNSYDLDLFGHASLFQYLNRTTSKPAADKLSGWLRFPAELAEITRRQQTIAELKPRIDWRQKMITLGYLNKKAGSDPQSLLNWVKSTDFFPKRTRLKALIIGLSAFAIVLMLLTILLGLPAGLLIPVFAINFFFYFSQGQKISRLHEQVGRSSELLQTYAATIKMIEEANFDTDKLKELQQVFLRGIAVSKQIKRLSKIVSRLDTRFNIMVAVPLNLILFWDIHCCLALEKWKRNHEGILAQWFSAMAEFEVLSCFANMAFNNPEWPMPKVIQDYFVLEAREIGHPLIPSARRVCNSIDISSGGKTVLVTGSNMSGKSTFLRTCGVNTVLALAGAPVCAAAFTVSHVQVYSSMRISDSLEDNTSSFYAELKRLAAIIREAEHNKRLFLLLDEILRGTNSNDRYIGSVALIKQLIGYETVSVVATHDLKLADLADELPDRIDNYHFDVKIDGEELYFDYKLNPGICTSMNASILMKKMGIRIGTSLPVF